MDFLQWAIATIIGILLIFVGREWQKRDRANEKDRKTLSIIVEAILQETIWFLNKKNFGSAFRHDELIKLMISRDLREKPDFFFLNQRLEKLRLELFSNIESFLNACYERAYKQYELNDEYIRINRRENYDDQDEGYKKILSDQTELNEKTKLIWKSYEKLIAQSHRVL